MNKVSDSKNIKLGIVISYLTLIVTIVGSIVVTRKVLDYVGDANYGLYSFVTSITMWLTIVGNAVGASFVRFATIEKDKNGNENQVKTLYNRFFIVVALISVLIAGGILLVLYLNNVQLFGYEKTESDILYILFAYSIVQIGITIAFSVYNLFINYKKKFIFARSLTLFLSFATYAGNWIIAYLTKNILYISLYALIHSALTVVVQIIYVRFGLKEKGFYTSKIVDKTLFRQIFAFSSILLFGAVVSQISNYVDKTILGAMGLPEQVTLYQLGQQFSTYVIVLSSSVVAVYIPTVNELVVKKRDEELNKLFLKVSKFQMIIICLVVFGFLSCGKDFVVVWVGMERVKVFYIAAAWLILLLCSETMNLSIEIQRARNKHLFRCITFFSLSVGNIGLSLLLIHFMGRDKAVEACLLGSVIVSFLSNWVALNIYNKVKMELPILRYFFDLFIHCLYGEIAFGASYLISLIPTIKNLEYSIWSLLIKGSIFVAIYALLIFIFDRHFVLPMIFKKTKRSSKNINSENISEKDIEQSTAFLINSRDIYYFKYTNENLFIEVGYINNLPHPRIRKYLQRAIKYFPNSTITRLLVRIFVPIIYPENALSILKTNKNICFFDVAATPELLQYSLLNSKRRTFVFYWNQIDPVPYHNFFTKLLNPNQIFTYSRIESDLYGIEHIAEPLMKIEGLVEEPDKAKYEYDFYFLGRVKVRGEVIVNYCQKLYDAGFKVKADILCEESENSKYEKYPFINILDGFMTYEDYLRKVNVSKCLLEVAAEENLNVTWRAFESFLYERKLLTNNKYSFDEPYLDDTNVLLMSLENFDKKLLEDFMSLPYDKSKAHEEEWDHSLNDFVRKIYIRFNS